MAAMSCWGRFKCGGLGFELSWRAGPELFRRADPEFSWKIYTYTNKPGMAVHTFS